ncbi:hypothetical protein [Candidatus Rhabdochlamydia porcellionis]|jgi:hypothetical protein|uniref:Uncharacterized protein n=1 Tax=Candidatus Rhabdochlamydia porcellionis TaxID=225148 RepID=A0ABX8Z5K8_9BACT|nr:hypothetical protein [Candidatus Rhabdochlamydia porcellionis]QZA59317.1 hypothetical protein RHAB15C_0001203 [Candidatus Rhabdochlamydia porcellionis]
MHISRLTPQSIIPSAEQFQISNAVKNVARNLNRFAIPVITFIGLTNMKSVEGGPITYASCVVGCELLASSATGGIGSVPALQACLYSCLPILAAPWCP